MSEEETAVENTENADTSTANDIQQEKIEFTDDQQAYVNKIAASKAFEVREQKRRGDALEARVRQLEEPRQEQMERPVVPELPSAYEDNYQDLMIARDAAIKSSVIYDASAQRKVDNAQYFKVQEERIARTELDKKVADYSEVATKKGITPEQLREAGGKISSYGLDDRVSNEILMDGDGPLIALYLASNPQKIDELNNSSDFNRWSVYNEIKAHVANKQQFPGAPNPVASIQGSGIAARERGPAGATYT